MKEVETLTIRKLEREGDCEYFVTARPSPAAQDSPSLRVLMGRVAEALGANDVQVLQEKIFALRSHREQIMGWRAEALGSRGLDPSVPVTFLEGVPADGTGFAGWQLWGVSFPRARERSVHTVEHRGLPVGRRYAGPGFRMLTLAALDGSEEDGSLPSCAPCQAKNMFRNAGSALSRAGFDYRQVARTWIYLARILDWYGEFNRVRTDYYDRVGLAAYDGAVFPASTGIQAQSEGEECLMDLLAVDARPDSGVLVRPVLGSSRQQQAFAYGSAFSRATVVERANRKTIFVSGTASIDNAGRSVHLEDPEAQVVDTLLSLAALLEDQGAALGDVGQCVVYCKNRAAYEAYQSIARRLSLPDLPAICVIADVCRPELLVEIEAVAIG